MTTEEKSNFSIEVAKWKKIYSSISVKQRPDAAVGALSECSGQSFQALNKVLTVFLPYLWEVYPVRDLFLHFVASSFGHVLQ